MLPISADPRRGYAPHPTLLVIILFVLFALTHSIQTTTDSGSNNNSAIATAIHDVTQNQNQQQQQQPVKATRSIVDGDSANERRAHHGSSSSIAAGFLLSEVVVLNSTDPLERKLSDIVGRQGPDMRPSRDYKDFKDISVNVSMRAWSLLHKHAQLIISERIQLIRPVIDELFESSKVSERCHSAINATFEGAKNMESWAVKLFNSWGQFPMSGIFEGTYGDVGAFHTCVDIKNIRAIDHAHYCSMSFRPVMPSRPDYELVVRKEPKALRELFDNKQQVIHTTMRAAAVAANSSSSSKDQTLLSSKIVVEQRKPRDALAEMLEHAQYHHYVYYKMGTCWPIGCSPFDVKRIVKMIGRRNVLMYGPVKCYSKNADDYEEEFPEDFAQELDAHRSKDLAVKEEGETPPVELVMNANERHQHAAANQSHTDFFQHLNQTRNATTKANKRKLVISVWDKNDGIFIWKPHFNRPHWVALSIICVVSVFIASMTLIDLIFVRMPPLMRKLQLAMKGLPLRSSGGFGVDSSSSSSSSDDDDDRDVNGHHQRATTLTFKCQELPVAKSSASSHRVRSFKQTSGSKQVQVIEPKPFFWSLVDDCSILTNSRQFFRVSEGQMRNDILCLNGIRCITMIWIIMTHTMMYNDWSAFARTRYVEVAVSSLFSQPFFNGSYLVDTFFLMSGLLSAFTAFKHSQGMRAKFNSFAYIFGRWLRLTPQIFFVSMMFIVLPAISYGPHWFPIVGEYSENCQTNWWINVLHWQAFYKKHEMCNFVTWWISIDFFYHYFALAVVWVIMLAGHRFGFLSMTAIVLCGIGIQCYQHFDMAMPPNILSTIPQTGAMWTTMTLDFFWTPYTHVVPFFFGFYIGYLMALKRKLVMKQLNTRRALIGWTLSVSLLFLQSYSTYWWVIGEAEYSRITSTTFYTICQIVWATSLCWIIIACHHNYGGFVNRFLSWKVFIVLGKASYLVYLSHFQVLFLNFGNQNLLLEPTIITMLFLIIGNIFLSTLLGIFLCIVFELPWLKAHRRLMKYV